MLSGKAGGGALPVHVAMKRVLGSPGSQDPRPPKAAAPFWLLLRATSSLWLRVFLLLSFFLFPFSRARVFFRAPATARLPPSDGGPERGAGRESASIIERIDRASVRAFLRRRIRKIKRETPRGAGSRCSTLFLSVWRSFSPLRFSIACPRRRRLERARRARDSRAKITSQAHFW